MHIGKIRVIVLIFLVRTLDLESIPARQIRSVNLFLLVGGYYNIVSLSGTNNAIDDPFANFDNGTLLKIFNAVGDNQKWKMTDAGGGCCRIAPFANNSVFIDLKEGTVVNGVVQLYLNGVYSKWKTVEVAP